MGEIFRQERPEKDLPWTGERLVQGVGGSIENEHLHRYFLARDLCRGRDVLDVASGEGYGAALLAQSAASVIGVEIEPDVVQHASEAYLAHNLRFVQGSATRLPAEDASVDVVTSFETLEHFFDHDLFLQEVRRVLRPDGVLMVSTPDADVYSGPASTPNLFHVLELTTSQFARLLGSHFPNVSLMRQRVMIGSAIVSDGHADPVPALAAGPDAVQRDMPLIYEQRGPRTFESHRRLPRAPYLLALASAGTLPAVGTSLFIRSDDLNAPAAGVQAELDRLRAVELQAVAQTASARETTDAAAPAEIDRLNQQMAAQQSELERLRGVEDTTRRQAVGVRQIESDLGTTRLELQQVRAELTDAHSREQAAAEVTRLELQQARAELADAGGREHAADARARDAVHEAEGLRRRCSASDLVSRQQTLALARLREQLTASLVAPATGNARPGHAADPLETAERDTIRAECEALRDRLADTLAERDSLRVKADDYMRAYAVASRMIVPIWMRRLVPLSVRSIRHDRTRSSASGMTHGDGE